MATASFAARTRSSGVVTRRLIASPSDVLTGVDPVHVRLELGELPLVGRVAVLDPRPTEQRPGTGDDQAQAELHLSRPQVVPLHLPGALDGSTGLVGRDGPELRVREPGVTRPACEQLDGWTDLAPVLHLAEHARVEKVEVGVQSPLGDDDYHA
jgi:hypothetical protein